MQSVQKAEVAEIISKWFPRPCLFLWRSEEPQPAESQFEVRNPEPLLFPVNCVMYTDELNEQSWYLVGLLAAKLEVGGGIWNFLKPRVFFFVVLLLISLFECIVPNKRSKMPLDRIYCSWWLQLCVNIRKQQGPAFQESLEQCHEDKCPDWCSHTPQLSCCF